MSPRPQPLRTSGIASARLRIFRVLFAALALVAAGVAAVATVALVRARNAAPAIVVTGPEGDDLPSPRGEAYAFDPVTGLRPRRNLEQRFVMHALHEGPAGGGRDKVVRRSDNLSLIRVEDVTTLPAGPRLLLAGDSHMMGVVSNADNASDRLEARLRARGFPQAAVFNASCGFYSLYQEVLRLRVTAPALAPSVLVDVVYLGNDLLELDDLSVPHLDDALNERPADASPPPETTSARMRWLALPEEMLFWQGMNQATYFHQRPERFEPVCAKARRSLELLRDLAAARDAVALVVLLPGYDLVFPDRVAALNEPAKQVVATGANAKLRERLLAATRDLGLTTVDALDAFRADGREDLYASDYHIFVRGHALLAEQVAPALEAALAARKK